MKSLKMVNNILFLSVFVFLGGILFQCTRKASEQVDQQHQKEAIAQKKKRNKKKPIIVWKKKHHDFGTIKEGEVVNAFFPFENIGEYQLEIHSVQSSCGCTTFGFEKEKLIKPGKSDSIKVTFNSKGFRFNQQKKITLLTNLEEGIQELSISAYVVPN